jgi:hypothetical protein
MYIDLVKYKLNIVVTFVFYSKFMSYQRKVAILISISLLILCFLLNFVYRPYIYRNQIFDFYFADTFASLLSIPCASLFFWGICKKNHFRKILWSSLIGFLLYEFFLGHTFDWYDVIALVTSTFITHLFYLLFKNSIVGKNKTFQCLFSRPK